MGIKPYYEKIIPEIRIRFGFLVCNYKPKFKNKLSNY